MLAMDVFAIHRQHEGAVVSVTQIDLDDDALAEVMREQGGGAPFVGPSTAAVPPSRGRLHIFIGAAPAVGKSHATLAEGKRLPRRRLLVARPWRWCGGPWRLGRGRRRGARFVRRRDQTRPSNP